MTNCRSPSVLHFPLLTASLTLQVLSTTGWHRQWAPRGTPWRRPEHSPGQKWHILEGTNLLQWSILLPRMLSLIPKAFFHFSSPCLPNHLHFVLHISFSIGSIKYTHKPLVSTIPSRTGWGMRQISSLFSGLLADQGKETKHNKIKSSACLTQLFEHFQSCPFPSSMAHTAPQAAAAGWALGKRFTQQSSISVGAGCRFCLCTLGNLS